MNIQELIQYIELNIKQNGIGSITGTVLQQILVEICENITPSEVPKPLKISDPLPTEDGTYLALESGLYSNGIDVDLSEGITYLVLDEGVWSSVVYPVNLVPDGVVEEGNTKSVSGDTVYENVLENLKLSKVKRFFPYDTSVEDFNKIKPFTNIVLDATITNKREGYVYSIGHIVRNIASGQRELRIYRSNDGGVTNSGILFKTYYASGPEIYTGSGIEFTDDDVVTGAGVIYENIKLVINVAELLKITDNHTEVYANNFPLSPLVLSGEGNGMIKSYLSHKRIDDVLKSHWNILPYGTPVSDTAIFVDNAIKEVKIYGFDSNRYYFIYQIVNTPTKLEVLIQSSSTPDLSTDVLNVIRFQSDRSTGVKSYIDVGNHYASKMEITVNWDFLNTNIDNPQFVFTSSLPIVFNFMETDVSGGAVVYLENIDYTSTISPDNCNLKTANKQTISLSKFNVLNNDNTYSRVNSNGDFIISEDGDYEFRLALYQPNTSTPDTGSINDYLSDVKYPFLPASLPESINLSYAQEGLYDYKHPEIVDLESEPIGGYRYWITTSTHPYEGESMEDESLYVSNDFNIWLRIRAFDEEYIEGVHAVGITMPPQNFVTDSNVIGWNQFFPIPRTGSVINVNGVNKTISGFLKHDPIFTYDKDEKALYWILSYHFKFTDDAGSQTPAESNKFNICIKTLNGSDYYLVRDDGTTVLLDTAENTDIFFTQTGGKNNYIRWIDHGTLETGGSLVYYNSEWWCFYGKNGSLIYKNDKIYNIFLSAPIVSQQDVYNHPSHFVYNDEIYRWGTAGISLMNENYTFTLLPINGMFNGYKGDETQYKKCLYINSSGEGIWIVSEKQEAYKSIFVMPNSYALGKRGYVTLGKVNVGQMISACESIKKGYYATIEVFVTEKGKVKTYRYPFIIRGNFNPNHAVVRQILDTVKLKKGQQIAIDCTLIGYGSISVGTSDFYLLKQ